MDQFGAVKHIGCDVEDIDDDNQDQSPRQNLPHRNLHWNLTALAECCASKTYESSLQKISGPENNINSLICNDQLASDPKRFSKSSSALITASIIDGALPRPTILIIP